MTPAPSDGPMARFHRRSIESELGAFLMQSISDRTPAARAAGIKPGCLPAER